MSNIFNKLKVKKILSSLLALSIALMMVPALSLTAAATPNIGTNLSTTPQIIFYGETATFSCTATRSGLWISGGPNFRWYLDTVNVQTNNNNTSSAVTSTYTTPATLAVGTHSIYCNVADTGTIGAGNRNSNTATLIVLPNDLSSYTVSITGDTVYDGSAKLPTVSVEYGGTPLAEGAHYSVSLSGDNINAGTVGVTLTGIAPLSGTATGSFDIAKANSTFPTIEEDAVPTAGLTVGDVIGTVAGLVLDDPTEPIYEGDGQTFGATYTEPGGNHNPVTGVVTINVRKLTSTPAVSISGWTYNDSPNPPFVSGNTSDGATSFNYTGGPDGTYNSATPPSTPGSYTVTFTTAETATYKASTATANFTISKADQAALVVGGLDALYERGAFPFDVTLSTTGGSGTGAVTFFVSGPATINGNVLTVTGVGTVTVMASKAADENYRVESGTGTATVTDIDAPTGTIAVGTNNWNSFFNTVTFGLFFKETKQVTITAVDNAPTAVIISYFISDAEVAVGDLPTLAWVVGDTFSINPNDQYVLYAKLEDASGNITYINSDGIVIYTDSTPSGIELGYTKTSGDQNIAINFNGNTINEIKNGTYTLVEGTDYTVNATGITLSGTYLDSLAASTTAYELVVSFNPLGEEYPDTPVAGSEAPAEVNIDITVSKAATIVATAPTASNVWKDDALSTSVLSDGVASVPGTFQWVDGTVAVPADGEYKQNLYDALEDAIADAKALTDVAPTTQEDVTAMTEKLQKAVDEFIPNVVKEEESSSKDDDSKNDDGSDDSSDDVDGSKRGGDGAPGTGTASIAGAMAVLALSGAAIVVLKKRK